MARTYSTDSLNPGDSRPRLRVNITYLPNTRNSRGQMRLVAPLDPAYPVEAAAKRHHWHDGILDLVWTCSGKVVGAAKDLAERVKFLTNSPASAGGMKYELLEGSDPLPGGRLMRMDDAVRTKFLFEVAKLGKTLHEYLFDEGCIRRGGSFDDHSWELTRKALLSVLSRRSTITATSQSTLLPWALLYDNSKLRYGDPDSVDFRGFWGFRHEIAVALRGGSPQLWLKPTPKVKAAICQNLDHNRYWHLGTGTPLSLPTGTPSMNARSSVAEQDMCDDIAKLEEKLIDIPWDCLYFFGHAGQKKTKKGASSAWLRLNQKTLHLKDVLLRGHRKILEPGVVFLNGCNSAPAYRWGDQTVVGVLDKLFRHQVSFIGNVAAVPNRFAAEMAVQCRRQFLLRRPIGQALVNSRRIMLRRYNNPLGLIYSLFGRGDIRIPFPIDAHVIQP